MMKIVIIYSTSAKITKKACKIISGEINSEIRLIPIEKAKEECLLKYNFIILAGSAYKGKVQNIFKRYIVKNLKTIKEKPHALVLTCEEDKNRFVKTFTEELVETSHINSNIGYELNIDEGNFIEKIKTKKIIEKYEENEIKAPSLNMGEINRFTDYINGLIDKRVD